MDLHQREVTLRFLAEFTDSNLLGNVHGGSVMKWIDQAGYSCAAGWCRGPCVTVYVGGIRFYKPIHPGDLVELHAQLIHTGHTSMHIAVDVQAGSPQSSDRTQTTHCIIVFVAIDAQGQPVAVPAWQPETPEDKALDEYAVRLMELRKNIEETVRPRQP